MLLGADVVNDPGRDPPFPDRLGKAEIEAGIVDQDHRFGRIGREVLEQGPELPLEVAVVAEHIPEAENTCFRDPVVEGASGGCGLQGHLRSSLAGETDAGIAFPKRAHQGRAMRVAAGFTGNDRKMPWRAAHA